MPALRVAGILAASLHPRCRAAPPPRETRIDRLQKIGEHEASDRLNLLVRHGRPCKWDCLFR